jgi:hypothetical protein
MQPDNQGSSVTPESAPAPAAPPRLTDALPPVLGPVPARSAGGPWLVSRLLSVCLLVFLATAIFAWVDDSLVVLGRGRALMAVEMLLSLGLMILSFVVYGLIGFVPMIPKRLFVPVTLFQPVAVLAALPLLIHHYEHRAWIAWGISAVQIVVGLVVLRLARGAINLRWPLVPESCLSLRRFRWRQPAGFFLLNILVLLPLGLAYLGVCSSVAVRHFSDGFVSLSLRGLSLQERKYVNAEGRSVHLVPMIHVGDAAFYRTLAGSFSSNALVLVEGVTDDHNLLTNRLTYKRVASRFGLAEQQLEFKPNPANIVHADVDISIFTTNTIQLLNLVTLFHSRGATPDTIRQILDHKPPPGFEAELWDDLLHKRNRHLLDEIHKNLADAETLIVPWGAAHMPEVGRELEKTGFRVAETREFTAIKFGSRNRSPVRTAPSSGE